MSQSAAFTSGLTNEEWSKREHIFRQFERAWLAGTRPVIDEYLPTDPGERRAVLVELVHADLEYRLKLGEPARVEDYLARYPELGSDSEAELGLIEAELELRQRREPDFTLNEFLARFPRHRTELLSTRRGSPRAGAPRFICPHCGAPIDAAPDVTREKVECPACEATFRVAPSNPLPWASERPPRLGRYELIEEVGRGQFGIVYRARDTELGRIVAVKVARAGWLASPSEADWFLREARSVAPLSHPHIVPVFDSGREGSSCYIVCEYVPGFTLAERLAAGRLTFRESAELAACVTEALDHAHERGVVHRDVKPSNILLDADGRPHLTDFGLAKREAGELTLTLEGELLGTPAYISPEQARGQAHGVDGRSDVYSLGVVLYEMLTGERPFLGNREALLLQVLEDEPRPPRRLNHRLPRDLETVCLKCLQKAPRDRYATAGHLASDLRRFLAGEPVHARPLGFSGRSWRWCRRNPVVSGLIAAVIVAVATGFAGVTWQWRQTRQQWLRAESGLEQAEKNFRMAWKSVDEFFVIVSQNVQLRRDLPGLEQFRAELLGKALNAYKEFLQQHGNDHKLQVEVANAYFNVGVIASTIGPEQDASSAFRNAIRIRETLVRANPGVTSFQRDLALTYVRLGSLQRRNGQFDDAERSDTLAVEIIRALVAAHPDDTDARWLLAGSLIGLANLRGESEKPAEAEHTFAEAVDILKALVAARPDVSQFKATLATAYQNLGKLQRDAGQLENAERSLAQAVELLIPLVAAQPNEPEFAFVLGHVYTESGLLQFELGRHRDAAQYFGKSLEIRRALVAKHPDHHEYKQDLAGAYNNLARVQGVLGRDDESESSLVQSRDILSALVNAHPDVLEYKRELAGTCTNLGSLAQKAGRLERAERSYREALEHLTTLRALLPGSREIVRNLANTYNGLGSVQTATRRLADAESSFRQSRDLFETLLASDVHDLRTRQLMAESLGALGNVLWELGRHEEADAAFEQAVDHQKIAFHEAPPALLQFRQRLSAHYERLAWSRRLLNRPSEAVAASLERQKLWPESPVELYNVACQLAQCVLLVGRGPALATAAQQSERMRCVDLALEMLHRAIDAGWHDAAHTANDPDLKSLRGDARFQALISDLAFPADAFAR